MCPGSLNWDSVHTSLSDVPVRCGGGYSAPRGPVGPQRGSEDRSPGVALCLPPAMLLSKDLEAAALARSGSPARWLVFLAPRPRTKRSNPFLSLPGGHVCSVNPCFFFSACSFCSPCLFPLPRCSDCPTSASSPPLASPGLALCGPGGFLQSRAI